MGPNSVNNKVIYKLFAYKSYGQDLALNNPRGLICHKTPTNGPSKHNDKYWNIYTHIFIHIHTYTYIYIYTHTYTSLVYFGLVSLFNGISTFVCYLVPKPAFKKNYNGTI